MVDIHCHMLPGVDDGASNWEMAHAMARTAIADGIKHVVCTPHANEQYRYHRSDHKRRLAELATSYAGQLEFSLGCDFHFSYENIQAALAAPDEFLISGTDYLLVEFSDYALPHGALGTLQRFIGSGVVPIITHPERNLWMSHKREVLYGLIAAGCIVQITANALTGYWGEPARAMCHWLLDRHLVHAVATDAHDAERRPPVLSAARAHLESRYGGEVATALTVHNPDAIVRNGPLPHRPHPVQP